MTETALTPPQQQALLDDVVSTMVTLEHTMNQLQALRSSLLATAYRIADESPEIDDASSREMAHRAVATELGAALRVSDRTIEAQMGDAFVLRRDFPATTAAFQKGRISLAHVRVITEAGVSIEDARRRADFEREVVARALEESPNRLRPFAKRRAENFRELSFQQRNDEARRRRSVWVRDLEDGQSELGVTGPTTIIHGIFERLTQMGHAVKAENERVAKDAGSAATGAATADSAMSEGADAAAARSQGAGSASDAEAALPDDRSLHEIRADLLADLLLTGAPTGHDTVAGLLGRIQGFVEVTVPVTTLMGSIDRALPAQLEGIGPVDPETARILAGDAPGWDRVMTDPVSGAVLAVDRYRPSEEMRRHLRARDRRCRFPGCRVTARKCDDDHTVDHAYGGATDVENLAGACRRHHVTKHHTPWLVRQVGGGVLEWTSPTGRTYVDRPPGTSAHVTFSEIDDLSAAAAVGADVEFEASKFETAELEDALNAPF